MHDLRSALGVYSSGTRFISYGPRPCSTISILTLILFLSSFIWIFISSICFVRCSRWKRFLSFEICRRCLCLSLTVTSSACCLLYRDSKSTWVLFSWNRFFLNQIRPTSVVSIRVTLWQNLFKVSLSKLVLFYNSSNQNKPLVWVSTTDQIVQGLSVDHNE